MVTSNTAECGNSYPQRPASRETVVNPKAAGVGKLQLTGMSALRPHQVSRFVPHFSIPYTSTLKLPGTGLGRPFFPPEGCSDAAPNLALPR
jgi:hypothetical protein